MSQVPKTIALGFLEDMTQGRVEQAFARLAPDVNYWIAGSEWSVGGTYDRAGLLTVFTEKTGPVLGGNQIFTVRGVTAEGERVAVELEGKGPTVDGRMYHNFYHLLFVVRDGVIVEGREYFDTLHTSLVICP